MINNASTPNVRDIAVTAKNIALTVTSILGGIWALLQIISWIGQRTKDHTTVGFAIVSVGLPLAGLVVFAVFKSSRISAALFFLGAVVVSFQYGRQPGPAGRPETLLLVIAWTGFTITYIYQFIDRILTSIDRLTNSSATSIERLASMVEGLTNISASIVNKL